MAGLGRRSHYRKHLTDAVLHDLPEPDESLGQRIARVVGTRGGNMFDVVVASPSASSNSADGSSSTSTADKDDASISIIRTPQLAFLPTKFRKLVWIKRNDFVIVECGDEVEDKDDSNSSSNNDNNNGQDTKKDGAGTTGFRYVISHILYKDQVKHIKSKGLWPIDSFFDDDLVEKGQSKNKKPQDGEKDKQQQQVDNDVESNDEPYEDDGGIVFDDPFLSDELMVNTNRITAMRVEDSSSDESDD
jgi:probable RNA-binding protein EIF1AD